MSIDDSLKPWWCSYLLSSCWVDQCRVRTIKMPLTLCMFVFHCTVYTLVFFLFVFIRVSVLVYVITCNNFCVKLTFLYYVNSTYKGVSMRADLTYEGITCVLYQHTWIWHVYSVLFERTIKWHANTCYFNTLFLQCACMSPLWVTL